MAEITLFQEWTREMNKLRSSHGESISVRPEVWTEVNLKGHYYGLSFILHKDEDDEDGTYVFKDEGTLTLWEKEKEGGFSIIKSVPFELGVFKVDSYNFPIVTEDMIPVLQKTLDEILVRRIIILP